MKSIRKSLSLAFAIVTVIFTFLPESFFNQYDWKCFDFLSSHPCFAAIDVQTFNVIFSRLACFFSVWLLTEFVYLLYLVIRKRITIEGPDYSIQVEYGNILKKKKCKRVISFDECYTTLVADTIGGINPKSICGQYLTKHTNLDIQSLISAANITPSHYRSKYQNKVCYPSGTIVPNGDDLLLAFARLDERGKGRFFSRDEYLECLNMLWKEIELFYAEKDVCIPVLGAGTTVIDGGTGASISQQDLLNIIIWSYKLSSHKIKAPHKLRIICKKNKGFSINNIE